MSDLLVREARHEDAERALSVLKRSIVELCVADHQNDPETLAHWLANKTPERFAAWLADPSSALFVAELGEHVRGVGRVGRVGRIQLCYAEPGYQRRGIGTAMLRALEQRARDWRLLALTLDSSLDACAFYAHHGYHRAGPAMDALGAVRVYPFQKLL